MIINFYLPENDSRIVDMLKNVSGQKKRSFSYIVREALEYYLLHEMKVKTDDLQKKRRRKQQHEQ